MTNPDDPIDARFSLANERTFLAWVRTALALLAGGVAAAKSVTFAHELTRWVVAGPPLAAGTLMAADAGRRWRNYDAAMRTGAPLSTLPTVPMVAVLLACYGVAVAAATALD